MFIHHFPGTGYPLHQGKLLPEGGSPGCRRAFLIFLSCCIFLAGCSGKEGPLLLPYRDTLQETGAFFPETRRESGITGSVCVIQDESRFLPGLLGAEAGALFDITQHRVIYSKEAFTRMNIASLTKLMTAYLVLKYADLSSVITLSDEVVISDPDAWLCGFEPGDQVSCYDLLCAALVYSGNDAANALAVAVSGSLAAFTELMNSEALLLGATGSHFANPNGLDQQNHYSTVYDIYLIFNACLKFSEFRKIISRKAVSISWKNAAGESLEKTFASGNAYLNLTAQPSGGMTVIGGKTGHTAKAGYCLAILSSDAQGNEYISVVIGTKTKQQVYAQTNVLYEMAESGRTGS